MVTKHKARIRWLTKRHFGPTYSTVALFESLRHLWPHEAWSIVLDFAEPPLAGDVTIAGIRLLVQENAPAGLLDSGSEFELYEGHQCVAREQVL